MQAGLGDVNEEHMDIIEEELSIGDPPEPEVYVPPRRVYTAAQRRYSPEAQPAFTPFELVRPFASRKLPYRPRSVSPGP